MCSNCKEWKPFTDYHKNSARHTLTDSYCKKCRRTVNNKWRRTNTVGNLLHKSKARARLKNIEHTITKQDIILNDICPILNVPLEYGTPYSPSLDRTNSSKGYIPGNVQVVSWRANTLKNNSTLTELKQLVTYMENIENNG